MRHHSHARAPNTCFTSLRETLGRVAIPIPADKMYRKALDIKIRFVRVVHEASNKKAQGRSPVSTLVPYKLFNWRCGAMPHYPYANL